MGVAKRSFSPVQVEVEGWEDVESPSSEEEEKARGQERICCDCSQAIEGNACSEQLCSGCYRPLCMRAQSECGQGCMTCGEPTCSGCALKVYASRDTQRQCLDCAVHYRGAKVTVTCLPTMSTPQTSRRQLKRTYSVHQDLHTSEGLKVVEKALCVRASISEDDLAAPSTPRKRLSAQEESSTPRKMTSRRQLKRTYSVHQDLHTSNGLEVMEKVLCVRASISEEDVAAPSTPKAKWRSSQEESFTPQKMARLPVEEGALLCRQPVKKC
eukprot:TRINITY_DN296_c0_g1_i1.p1 TRINITY_DN296_c0_g1~~TRINITY_DN296_c0_g1_i1.p1  ORF type:complete len:299 (-),score=71.55 TRINITY_DN296_c0_g1_i1:73-879(-)